MRAVRVLASLTALIAVTTQPAGAASHHDPFLVKHAAGFCKHVAHQLARNEEGNFFTRRGSLYGCANDVSEGDPFHDTTRLGPWTGHRGASFHGFTAVWVTRSIGAGEQPVDRVHFAFAGSKVRIDADATIGDAADDTVVQRIVGANMGAAWVTGHGAVMAIVSATSAATAIGAGTPGAAGPVDATNTLSQGLSPIDPDATALHVAVVGRWPAVDAAALARTLTFTDVVLDPDDCGHRDHYEATVQPIADQPAVGLLWENLDFDGGAC